MSPIIIQTPILCLLPIHRRMAQNEYLCDSITDNNHAPNGWSSGIMYREKLIRHDKTSNIQVISTTTVEMYRLNVQTDVITG